MQLTQILQKKYDKNAFKQTLRSISRSSIFLSFNAFSVILLLCVIRKVTGKFYYTLCAYTPGFFGSLLAIILERASRRPALAVYVTNMATETMFRIGVSRGYFRSIPKGEVLLFTATMSILMYLIKKNGYGNDPVSMALKFIVGREEAKRRQKLMHNNSISSSHFLPQSSTNIFSRIYEKLNSLFSKHKSCPHDSRSCPMYIAGAFIRPFLLGWLGQVAARSFSKPRRLLNQPTILRDNLLKADSFYFGLFLGCFTSIFKLVNCSLRWTRNEAEDWHGCVAGLAAGPAMFLSPNTSITLYFMWKCIEVTTLHCNP